MPLTELPFDLPGRIFGSPMPFGYYDPQGELLREFRRKKISVIVLLAEEEECLQKAGRNLRELYQEKGLRVVHLPIPDRCVPMQEDLDCALALTVELAQARCNIAIHCSAGIGRTGMFCACLAKKALGLSGQEAIDWVGQYIPGAVETRYQKDFVKSDCS